MHFPHRALVLVCIALATVHHSAAQPPDACLASFGGAPYSQRTTQYVSVTNGTLALQAVPGKALTQQPLLPQGYNFSLHSFTIPTDPTAPFTSGTVFDFALYQAPLGSPPGAPITTLSGRFTAQIGYDVVLSASAAYGEFVVDPSQVVWAGLLGRAGQPIALTISNVSAPAALSFAPVSCNQFAGFPNLTSFGQFSLDGCTQPAPPALPSQMILVNVRLWTQPCPCSLPVPQGGTSCNMVQRNSPFWNIPGLISNLTLEVGQNVSSDGDFTIDGTISIPAIYDSPAPLITTRCANILNGARLALASAANLTLGGTVNVIASSCVNGTFTSVSVLNEDGQCPFLKAQQFTASGLSVQLTPSIGCTPFAAASTLAMSTADATSLLATTSASSLASVSASTTQSASLVATSEAASTSLLSTSTASTSAAVSSWATSTFAASTATLTSSSSSSPGHTTPPPTTPPAPSTVAPTPTPFPTIPPAVTTHPTDLTTPPPATPDPGLSLSTLAATAAASATAYSATTLQTSLIATSQAAFTTSLVASTTSLVAASTASVTATTAATLSTSVATSASVSVSFSAATTAGNGQCSGPPPTLGAACNGGAWVVNSLPANVTISNPIIVIGDYESPAGSALTVVITSPEAPGIYFSGCVSLAQTNLTLVLQVSPEAAYEIVRGSCIQSGFASVAVSSTRKTCEKYKGAQVLDGASVRVLMQNNEDGCHLSAGATAGIAAAIVVVVLAISVGALCAYMRFGTRMREQQRVQARLAAKYTRLDSV